MLTAMALAATLIQTPPAPPDLSWMAGYWLDCSGGREASETWSDPRAGLIVGSAVTVRNGRAGFEASVIGPTPDGGLAYYAQPDGAPPTPFVLEEQTGQSAVFFNPDNDFPTRIRYRRDGDVMTARIEGQIGGVDRAIEWRFERRALNTRCPS